MLRFTTIMAARVDLSTIAFRFANRVVATCRHYQRPLKLLVGIDQYGII